MSFEKHFEDERLYQSIARESPPPIDFVVNAVPYRSIRLKVSLKRLGMGSREGIDVSVFAGRKREPPALTTLTTPCVP